MQLFHRAPGAGHVVGSLSETCGGNLSREEYEGERVTGWWLVRRGGLKGGRIESRGTGGTGGL